MTHMELLVESAGMLGIELTYEQTEKFLKFMDELRKWNRVINLSGITDTDQIITKHFVDSLTVLRYVDPYKKMIDIGTGAGFPGIPLAIADSSLNVDLLDSREKRIHFVRYVIRKLGLDNAEAYTGRAEDENNGITRGVYDFAVSRAYGNIKLILDTIPGYIKPGGGLIVMKGEKGSSELDKIRESTGYGLKVEDISELTLPFSSYKRVIVLLRKQKKDSDILKREG